MIKLVGFGLAVLMSLSVLPARAMDGDVEFLKTLGGVVIWQNGASAVVRFNDGTRVAVEHFTMTTSDACGNSYISSAADNSIAVNLDGDFIEYEQAIGEQIDGALAASLP